MLQLTACKSHSCRNTAAPPTGTTPYSTTAVFAVKASTAERRQEPPARIQMPQLTGRFHQEKQLFLLPKRPLLPAGEGHSCQGDSCTCRQDDSIKHNSCFCLSKLLLLPAGKGTKFEIAAAPAEAYQCTEYSLCLTSVTASSGRRWQSSRTVLAAAMSTEAEFSEVIETKVLRVLHLAIHSHLC